MRRCALAILTTTTLLAVLGGMDAMAEDVAWNRDVRSAWNRAQTAGRPLLVYVTSSHCPYCRKMADETLSDPQVVRRVQTSFVPVVVNADDPSGMASRLKVAGVPTTLLILPDGRIADRVEGYVSANRLGARLDSLLERMQGR